MRRNSVPLSSMRPPPPVVTASALLVAVLVAAGICRADAPPPGAPRTGSSAAVDDGVPTVIGDRSDPSYYRGRATAPSARSRLLWIPRIALFPIYALTEYGFRAPIKGLMTGAERIHLTGYLTRILQPTPNFSWSPTFIADLGQLTSGGLQMRWNHAVFRGNEFAVSASTGGPDFFHFVGQDRVTVGAVSFGLRGDFLYRPDRLFYGIGPRSNAVDRSFYRIARADVFGFSRWNPSIHVDVALGGGFRAERSSPSDFGRNGSTGLLSGVSGPTPSIEQRFQVPGEVPGFGQLDLAMADALLTLDSRKRLSQPSGVRFGAHAALVQDVYVGQRRFMLVEGELEAAIEVSHPNRVIALSLFAADLVNFGSEPIPLTHLVQLGRLRHPGFPLGRYTGQSAVVAEIEYRYPIWIHLDGFLLTSVGNVFGPHFSDFHPGLLTGVLGMGLRTRLENAAPFEILVALGSNRFENRFGIEGINVFARIDYGI